MSDALFDLEDAWRVEPAVDNRSTDQRRTDRQAGAIRAGVHPLALVFGATVVMHPGADRTATRGDGPRLPLRCGTCRYRFGVRHASTYPKCGARDGARVTRGPATDVRAWWPACLDYSPGDPALSPDAARWIP